MKKLVCICCPKGCRLTVDEENGYAVTGNSCPRGEEYGKNEVRDPRRVITSTVRIDGAAYRRCPVRTSIAVPKALMFDIMKELEKADLKSGVKRGDVVIADILGTGADVIVTKDM